MLIVGISFCSVSCTDDTDETFAGFAQKADQIPTYSSKSLAKPLAMSVMTNPAILNDLYVAVDKVCSYGLDENVTFYDIYNTSKSVFVRGNESNSLQGLFGTTSFASMGLNASNYFGNFNIYWGYHDNWDRITLPIICYVDVDSETNLIHGYQIVSNTLHDMTITEDEFDAEDRPIILVTRVILTIVATLIFVLAIDLRTTYYGQSYLKKIL